MSVGVYIYLCVFFDDARPSGPILVISRQFVARILGSATFFYPQGGLSQHAHQVAQAESFRWAGSLSPPTQVAQAEFRWLLAAGYW